MAWIQLFVAGLLEVGWAVGMKYTQGFTRLWPSVFTVIGMAASMYLLTVASRELPLGTAYTVWVGIGAAGASILGIYLFNEPSNFLRLFFLGLIIAGVVGLKITGMKDHYANNGPSTEQFSEK